MHIFIADLTMMLGKSHFAEIKLRHFMRLSSRYILFIIATEVNQPEKIKPYSESTASL